MHSRISENEKHLKFEQFFQNNYNRFVLQAIRIVKDGNKAEDIVQDCFIKLWDKRNEITFDSNALGYLYRMVRNKSIDYLRAYKPVANLEDSDIENASFLASDKVETEELQVRINNAIDALPEKCRQVFVLSRFENLSYKEIASQLDISPKTVENQISKALKQLRRKLLSFFFTIFF